MNLPRQGLPGVAHCASPVSFETLVAYWAGDLPSVESDAVEAHVMSCSSCTATSARVAAVAEALRGQIPPIVNREQVAKLGARGLKIVDNPVRVGERKVAVFTPGVDIMLHRLGGLDLSHAARVGVAVKVEETGDILFQTDDAPFDRDAGEVVIACQRHFSAFPPNIVFEVRSYDASHGEMRAAVYVVPHAFG